ncbi:MAG: hypothetical protein SYC29_03790, partial [Planctomycetota bacterium]|nr:hypothetical protein [Planctomycetota bacterium]
MMKPTGHNPAHRRNARRGNTMILVAGILALLVVIAAAYITRTQGGRVTATAVQHSATRDNNAGIIADTIAEEIAGALFADPVNPDDQFWALGLADSNARRLSPEPDALRYSVDRDANQNGRPDFPYNFAPYHTVPFTNWPDDLTGLSSGWPKGPGAPNGLERVSGVSPICEGNPVGNPGFGDTRWLRDTEPLRWNVDPLNDPMNDAFRHWRHLTNLSHPNNAFRIVKGIHDVSGTGDWGDDLGGGIITNLNYPFEQWLVSVSPGVNYGATGDAVLPPQNIFDTQWWQWFNNYEFVYKNDSFGNLLQRPPQNLYNLNDLDADGFALEEGHRPQDEFVPGTARWTVSRMLADADGDGFTDSFWFTAPTPIERGVRQIVAVSIVDNSALLNLNVATRTSPRTTAGETPADLSLCGQQLDTEPIPNDPNWNVGFFDSFNNRGRYFDYPGGNPYDGVLRIRWNPNRWDVFRTEMGVLLPDGLTLHPAFVEGDGGWWEPLHRRWYWLYAGSRPFTASWGLTPFTLADELELRMYHGQNYPWIFSRLEGAFGASNFTNDYEFLRSPTWYEESTPYLDQLNNTELMHDHRRKLAVYNGARNDELPPWLRWRWRVDANPAFVDLPQVVDNEMVVEPEAMDRFLMQSRRKLDLREMSPLILGDLDLGFRYLHERLPWTLLNIFADGDELGNLWDTPPSSAGSYFGSYTGGSDDVDELRELAAAYTANILAYRDADADAPLYDDYGPGGSGQVGAIPLPEWGETEPEDETIRYLGMERQPFLLEAFIGHVYEPESVTPPQGTLGWLNNGAPILLSTQDWDDDGTAETVPSKTLVIVQIANPYAEPIILASDDGGGGPDPDFPYEYRLDVLGEEPVSLSTIARAEAPTVDFDGDGDVEYYLPPARDNRPTTMIVYSIPYDPNSGITQGHVRDFFDLTTLDHPQQDLPDFPGHTIIADLRYPGYGIDPWSDDRSQYDGLNPDSIEDTIRLVRVDTRTNPFSEVVIDRMDGPDESGVDFEFLEGVVAMGDDSNMLPAWEDLGVIPPPDGTDFFPIPNNQPDPLPSHYMQWRSVVRAWGRDDDAVLPAVSDPDEINPRYISARKKIRIPEVSPQGPDGSGLDPRGEKHYTDGNVFNIGDDPEQDPGYVPPVYWPWFTVVINNRPGGLPDYSRKPTFFDMNVPRVGGDPHNEPDQWLYPDKGFYHSPYALQMLQKDGDFQQVGELLNVWLYGHKLEFELDVYNETLETFSERIFREQEEPDYGDDDLYVNRLRPGKVVGMPTIPPNDPGQNYPYDPQHAVAPMPAGLRLLDAFVCDGPGVNYNGDPAFANQYYFNNAIGFGGRLTPGLININTAPVEVLRTLPQWYKIIHKSAADVSPAVPYEDYPRCTLPETVISYRERFLNNQFNFLGFDGGPPYAVRENLLDDDEHDEDHRGDRGYASLGELRLLREEGNRVQSVFTSPDTPDDFQLMEDSWRVDFLAADGVSPFTYFGNTTPCAYLGTDVVGVDRYVDIGDGVADDAEEANMLLAGAS